MTGIIVLVFLSLLLDSRRLTLMKKGDADHLIDFTVLDPRACRIYCAELYLFSGPAADFTETHTIRSYGHSRDHQVSHPCPCYPPVKPQCNTSWAVDSSPQTSHSHFEQHFHRECQKFLPVSLNGPSVVREVSSSFWASGSSRGEQGGYLTHV